MYFGAIYDDDTAQLLTWKQFKELSVPFEAEESVKKQFIQLLLKTIKQFNKKVDAMGYVRKAKTFEEKVDALLSHGATYTKKGLSV